MYPGDTCGHRRTDWVAFIARLQPWYLLTRFPHELAKSIFVFIGVAIAIGIIGTAAVITGQPLIFPSLGPSAFLFFSQPTAPASSPRNAILSHGSGILMGCAAYGLLRLFPSMDPMVAKVAAATLSLGLISAWMVAAKIQHPPAASTTLIVALGLMVQWQELVAVMAAVVLLTVECYALNRLAGIASPIWGADAKRQGDGLVATALQTDAATAQKDGYAEIADRIVSRQKLPEAPTTWETLPPSGR